MECLVDIQMVKVFNLHIHRQKNEHLEISKRDHK